MYCVKCGVRLQDGVSRCPLCDIPVLYREEGEGPVTVSYSDRYPAEKRTTKFLLLGLITILMAVIALSCFVLCMKLYHEAFWSWYVMFGLTFLWIVLIFPNWFRRKNPYVLISIDIAALYGLLLFICLYTKGHWFLSFAFPVVGLVGVITLTALALYRNFRHGRLMITGILLMVIGASFMLIELFLHITFKTPMFLWSLQCVSAFGGLGLFLFIAALNPRMRDFLERRFFI